MQPMLNIAQRAAHKAAEIILRSMDRLENVRFSSKEAKDYVSDVDRASENAIINILRKSYPGHSILSEESGFIGDKDAEYQWIIDPLDGTTNFLRAVPHFAISIACTKNGKLEHALILDPIRHEEFHASRGRGATLNGRKLRVSSRINLNEALLGTGFPFKENQLTNIDNYLAIFKSLSIDTAGIRRAGAASLDLAYVAAGRFDGFWENSLAPWDIAAGILLIQEAGGLVTDFKGGHSCLTSGEIVAANPKCLKIMLNIISSHIKDKNPQHSKESQPENI